MTDNIELTPAYRTLGKIALIKYVRSLTGYDLVEAKDLVEAWTYTTGKCEFYTDADLINLSLTVGKVVRGDWRIDGTKFVHNVAVDKEDVKDLEKTLKDMFSRRGLE